MVDTNRISKDNLSPIRYGLLNLLPNAPAYLVGVSIYDILFCVICKLSIQFYQLVYLITVTTLDTTMLMYKPLLTTARAFIYVFSRLFKLYYVITHLKPHSFLLVYRQSSQIYS